MPGGLGALKHRDYALFFGGQTVSLIGSWMQAVGQSWLILQMTGSPLKLGLISMLQFLPVTLFSLFAGVVADRFPKRRLLIFTQTTLMLLAFSLSALVWTGTVQYWHIAVLAALLGLVNAVDMPARQSFVPEMVGKEDMMSAIALNSTIFNGARIVGPAVAGFMVARYGIALAYLVNGATFLAVIGALLAVRAEGQPQPRSGKNIFAEVGEGLRYVWQAREMALLVGLALGVGLFVLNWGVLVPLLAREVLLLDSKGYGWLMSLIGAGALAGSLSLVAWGRSAQPVSSIVAAAVALCGATMAMLLVSSFWAAGVLLVMIGFFMIRFLTSINSTLQATAPDGLRGRVMSLYTFSFAGTAPLGSLLSGSIAEAFGARASFFACGALGLISVGLLMAWWSTDPVRRVVWTGGIVRGPAQATGKAHRYHPGSVGD